jgi:dipeptidyl aminopeptidase/acylaminoacyl peptidase
MSNQRTYQIVLIVATAIAALAQSTGKRPLHHRDYDSWRTIQNQTLSNDGKFLAYALFPQEGDGEIVVRDLNTGREIRQSAGALPATPDNTNFELPATEQAAARNVHIAFTHDHRFLIAGTFPGKAETDKAKKERKRPDEMPRPGLVIIDLTSSTATRVADVASFQAAETAAVAAYLKGPKPGSRAPAGEANDDDDQDQRRGGAAAGVATRARNQLGSDLVLLDLRAAQPKERTFEDVSDYSLSKDAKALVFAVASKKEESNGVYVITPGDDSAPRTLLAGKGHYSRLTFDLAQRQLAFLSDRDDAEGKPAKYKAYLWNRTAGTPVEIVSNATPGFRDGFVLFDRGPMNFSRDGSRLFLSSAPAAVAAAADRESASPQQSPAPGASDDKVLADLWHWKDGFVQPMQKVRAAQERTRSYRAVWHVEQKKFVQLSDPSMAGLTPTDNGQMAMGTDDRAYRHLVDYDGNFNDVYVVDTMTGARKVVIEKLRGGGGGPGGAGGPQWSPDGKYLLAFQNNHWNAVDASDGKILDLTGKLGPVFHNEDHDSPSPPPPYGSAGWTKDGKWALVYDRYDVWAIAPATLNARKLTNGRDSRLQFRLVRLDRSDDEEERGLDPAKPLLFRAENLNTRDSGFYSLARFESGEPQRLLMGAKNYRALLKAKDADVIALTATTFHDQPDLYVSDSRFRDVKKVTDANPQQAKLLWGTGELILYRNDDGVELQAALYKPENFDPSKKYPMLIYIYERLTQNVNNFVSPRPGTSINIAYYVSNGYLVLTPDIVYNIGHPGQSALKCVLPAIQAVVDKGFVDRNAIGIQGHSWGGFQAAYLLTQTNVFRAAEAGAPVGDMISAYNGIRWGTGLPRQFQYEKTQSRIGGSIWEYPLRFIENSAVFMADRIHTPVLMIQNDGDDAVPWYQGIELFLSLRRLGKEAYLFDYNGEAHGLRKRPNQKDYTVRMQQFFDHFLKGAPAPEWMEKGIPYIEREQEKQKIDAVYATTDSSQKK